LGKENEDRNICCSGDQVVRLIYFTCKQAAEHSGTSLNLDEVYRLSDSSITQTMKFHRKGSIDVSDIILGGGGRQQHQQDTHHAQQVSTHHPYAY
jgi:hypothetical protein